MQMSEEAPKKRGRRKKMVAEVEVSKPTKKTVRKCTEIHDLQNVELVTAKSNNVIMYLRCSMKDIDQYLIDQKWKTDNLTYDPKVPIDFVPFGAAATDMHLLESATPIQTNIETTPPAAMYVCSKCEQNMDVVRPDAMNEKDVDKVKQLKMSFYKNEIPEKKVDCFWCTCPYDNEPFHILQYGPNRDVLAHCSFCSPECAVAHLFNRMHWDDSTKMESYQLMNHFYKMCEATNQNIKPAASPYYFLDKYYGSMTIQEYRRMSKSSNIMLCIDKPVTRMLPELHEDSDRQFSNGLSLQTRGNYKVRKQSEKAAGPSRNTILRDSFRGITVP
jgi:hypothetical protein